MGREKMARTVLPLLAAEFPVSGARWVLCWLVVGGREGSAQAAKPALQPQVNEEIPSC